MIELESDQRLRWVRSGAPRSFRFRGSETLSAQIGELKHSLKLATPYSKQGHYSELLHQLRTWGTKSVFPPPPSQDQWVLSGDELLCFLLGTLPSTSRTAPIPQTLFFLTDYGAAVRGAGVGDLVGGRDGKRSQAHIDQLLSDLGEARVPVDALLRVDGKAVPVAALVSDAMGRVCIGQEMEFSAIAFAFYAQTPTWRNRWGSEVSFADIAEDLMRQYGSVSRGKLACAGTHVPYALALLRQVDRDESCLRNETRDRLRTFFANQNELLRSTQRPTGVWGQEYLARLPQRYDLGMPPDWLEICATGHVLEFLAFLEAEDAIDDAAAVRACRGLIARLAEIQGPGGGRFFDFASLSHAVRALALWHGSYDAWDAILAIENLSPSDESGSSASR